MISDSSIFIRVIDILNFSQTFCRLTIHDDLFFFLFGKSEPIMISSYKCSILLVLDKAKQRFSRLEIETVSNQSEGLEMGAAFEIKM